MYEVGDVLYVCKPDLLRGIASMQRVVHQVRPWSAVVVGDQKTDEAKQTSVCPMPFAAVLGGSLRSTAFGTDGAGAGCTWHDIRASANGGGPT